MRRELKLRLWFCAVVAVWACGALHAARQQRAKRDALRIAGLRTPPAPVPASQKPFPAQLVLLTTFFAPPGSPARAAELSAALLANVRAGLFDEVHLLVSPDDADAVPAAVRARPEVRVVETRPGLLSSLPDRYAAPGESGGGGAMLYSDFFAYANARLLGRIVVLSNADIEYDASATRMRTEGEIAQGTRGAAYALSRVNPPCPDAPPCRRQAWCRPTLCNEDFASYDAFVFVPPVPARVVNATNHRQDRKGAENIVVGALADPEIGRMLVTNPCADVRLTHRHCVRNVTAYLAAPRIDDEWRFASCPHRRLTPAPNEIDAIFA